MADRNNQIALQLVLGTDVDKVKLEKDLKVVQDSLRRATEKHDKATSAKKKKTAKKTLDLLAKQEYQIVVKLEDRITALKTKHRQTDYSRRVQLQKKWDSRRLANLKKTQAETLKSLKETQKKALALQKTELKEKAKLEQQALKEIQKAKIAALREQIKAERKAAAEKLRIAKKELKEELKLTKQIAAQKLRDEKSSRSRAERIQKAWTRRRMSNLKKSLQEELRLETAKVKRKYDVQRRWDKRRAANAKKALKKETNSYASKWSKAFGTLSRYASAGAIMFKGVELTKEVFTDFVELEKTLDRVSVITGSTSKDVQELTTTVYTMGAAFGTSTEDARQFIVEMAKLGKTTEEINSLSIHAAGLSAILGEDLATSGRLMVTTMNQFGLATHEAGRVSSTFFKAIRTSPINVKDLQTSLQYVGSAAYAAGIEIEQVGAMISTLSELGLRASKIGTGLRNVILKLSQDSRGFSVAMDEMAQNGLSLSEAVELFGKRGALAGYNLAQEWGRLKEIIESPIIPDTNLLWESLRATDNFITRMARNWQVLKSVFTGNTFDADGEIARMLNLKDLLKVYTGLEFTDLPLRIQESKKEIQKAWAENPLYTPDGKLIQPGFEEYVNAAITDSEKAQIKWHTAVKSGTSFINAIKEQPGGQELYDALLQQYTIDSGQVNFNQALALEASKFEEQVSEQIQGVIDGAWDNDAAVAAVKRLATKYKETLKEVTNIQNGFKLTYEQIQDVGSNALSQSLGRLAGVVKDKDFSEAVTKWEELKAELKEMQTLFGKGELINDDGVQVKEQEFMRKEAKLSSAISKLCELFAAQGTDLCNPKKAKDDFEDFITEVKRYIAMREAAHKRAMALLEADDLSLSTIRSDSMRDLQSFSDLKKLNPDMNHDEVYALWEENTANFFKGLRAAIDEEYNKQLADIEADRSGRIENSYETLVDINYKIGLARAAGDDSEVKNLEKLAFTEYQKILNATNDSLTSVIELNIKKKRTDDRIDDDEKNTPSITEGKDKLAEQVATYSNYLNQALDAYSMYAREMDAQRQAAFEREKENINNRAKFEKDQLKVAADKNLLTAEQYNAKSMKLEKKRIRDVNAVAKKQFEAKKRLIQGMLLLRV